MVMLSPVEPKVGDKEIVAIPICMKSEEGVTSRMNSVHISSDVEDALYARMDSG